MYRLRFYLNLALLILLAWLLIQAACFVRRLNYNYYFSQAARYLVQELSSPEVSGIGVERRIQELKAIPWYSGYGYCLMFSDYKTNTALYGFGMAGAVLLLPAAFLLAMLFRRPREPYYRIVVSGGWILVFILVLFSSFTLSIWWECNRYNRRYITASLTLLEQIRPELDTNRPVLRSAMLWLLKTHVVTYEKPGIFELDAAKAIGYLTPEGHRELIKNTVIGLNRDFNDAERDIEILKNSPAVAVPELVKELRMIPQEQIDKAVHFANSSEPMHVIWCLRALETITGRQFFAGPQKTPFCEPQGEDLILAPEKAQVEIIQQWQKGS